MPEVIEKRFYDDELMLTGKVDLIAHLNGKKTIVDFKTGSQAHLSIWRLQATFYRFLTKEPIDDFLFVHLNRDGTFPALHHFTYDPKDLEVCLAALKCFHFFNPWQK